MIISHGMKWPVKLPEVVSIISSLLSLARSSLYATLNQMGKTVNHALRCIRGRLGGKNAIQTATVAACWQVIIVVCCQQSLPNPHLLFQEIDTLIALRGGINDTNSQSRSSAHRARSWTNRQRRESGSLGHQSRGRGSCWSSQKFFAGVPYWINCYAPLIQADVNTRYQQESVTIDGPEIQLIADACREADVSIVIGISERRVEGHTCHNSAVFITPENGVVGVHRKLQPTYGREIHLGARAMGFNLDRAIHLLPAGRVKALLVVGSTP